MVSEEEIIIAFVFERSGKNEMLFSEFYLTISMDLNWFTPDDAKALSNNFIKNKFLIKTKESVKPGFDVSKIKVPLGFYPSKQILEKKEPVNNSIERDLFTDILDEIAAKAKKNKEELLEKINKIQEEKNITKETAALMVGKDFEIDLTAYFEKVEEEIIK